ncbi:hypothetical protein [Pantoea sp. C2G6]|uniref:hypothetical protein n=1 Tax=Pantoea sp. C2G6 TaxID=3243084 RepID=UPI003ED95DA2
MTRALLLAIGLTIAGSAVAGSINGAIGVRLVIYSRCEIKLPAAQPTPQINCGRAAAAQPRVTDSTLSGVGSQKQGNRLITVEW